jgi:hypothetical protein
MGFNGEGEQIQILGEQWQYSKIQQLMLGAIGEELWLKM